MPVSLQVAAQPQRFLGKYGPNTIFGTDVDIRKNFTNEEAESRFMEVWEAGLGNQVESATAADIETVRGILPEKNQVYLNPDDEHRVLRYMNMQFVAQINDRTVNQFWHVPTYDENPKLLRVVFNTVEDRERFHKLAKHLGWKDEELGLALVQDFINKHPDRLLR